MATLKIHNLISLFAAACGTAVISPVTKAQETPGGLFGRVELKAPDRAPRGDKKLIEWGFDQPNTARFKANIVEMEKAPFDGVILAAYGFDKAGKKVDLSYNAFSREPFERSEFGNVISDLKATHPVKFTDNFLRLNVGTSDIDWFDDSAWSAITGHAAIASWICREGKLTGFMFDTEQYNQAKRPFYYYHLADHTKHTFDQYREEARKRGREFGAALTSEKQDPTILFTFTNTFQVIDEKAPLQYSSQGLLPSFIDGLLEGASAKATFVDALEHAYGARSKKNFESLRRSAKAGSKFSTTRKIYDTRMTVGFGLWMDKDWAKNGWDPANLSKNFYQPQAFEETVKNALEQTDKYVWVYTEKVDWWKGTGLNLGYVAALQNARATASPVRPQR